MIESGSWHEHISRKRTLKIHKEREVDWLGDSNRLSSPSKHLKPDSLKIYLWSIDL